MKKVIKKIEEIIKETMSSNIDIVQYKWECKGHSGFWEALTTAILNAGYIHKSQITIDEGEVGKIIKKCPMWHTTNFDGVQPDWDIFIKALKDANIWKIKK